MKLFDSKIEPIRIENSNSTIIIDGLKEVEREPIKNL